MPPDAHGDKAADRRIVRRIVGSVVGSDLFDASWCLIEEVLDRKRQLKAWLATVTLIQRVSCCNIKRRARSQAPFVFEPTIQKRPSVVQGNTCQEAILSETRCSAQPVLGWIEDRPGEWNDR